MTRWSKAQYLEYVNKKPKRKNKYRNIKTEIDGIKFDSKKEAARYSELKLLEKAGEIEHLELQPRFRLLEPFKYKDKSIRAIDYIADFKYIDNKGVEFVEDVKGKKTDVYNIKKKLFLNMYGEKYEFREV